MDDRGMALLRQLMSEVEGAPYPAAEIQPELYGIWYEHAQSAAQEALEYLNRVEPGHGRDASLPEGLA